MVSIGSVKLDLAAAQGQIMMLMQAKDDGDEFSVESADELFDAYEFVKKAVDALGRAQLYE